MEHAEKRKQSPAELAALAANNLCCVCDQPMKEIGAIPMFAPPGWFLCPECAEWLSTAYKPERKLAEYRELHASRQP